MGINMVEVYLKDIYKQIERLAKAVEHHNKIQLAIYKDSKGAVSDVIINERTKNRVADTDQ